MGVGSRGSAAGFLLTQAGQMPTVGQGMPQRVPIEAGTRPYGGPNLTEYQKLLALSGPSAPVIQPSNYQRIITQPFNLTAANTDVLAVTAPPVIRPFLLIRNDQTSAGNILVAFDLIAVASTAAIVLSPGGFALFDDFVPQNDIHVACTVATSLCVISYANATFNPSQT